MMTAKEIMDFLKDKPGDMPVRIMLEANINGKNYQFDHPVRDRAVARDRIVFIGNEVIVGKGERRES